MPDSIISPSRHRHEATITSTVLFFVNPGDVGSITNQARQLKAKTHSLFHSNLFEISGEQTVFWAGPALGAPAAVMTLEKLIALGCKKIIVYGWCGSLVQYLKAEEIFLPTWSLSEEGSSRHYPIEKPAVSDTVIRLRLADFLRHKGYSVKEGPIWTTDAPYRETRQKVNDYIQKGIMAVDMEFSALSTVAAYRSVSLTATMLVSDELFHKVWRPLFATKSFKKKSLEVFKALSEFTGSIS